MGNVFSNGDRFTNTSFPELNGSLPISERYFSGGGNSIRGFDYEEAGPRVVIVPQGTFRDSDGNPVFLDPFTVPFGGNALALVNLEARIPLTKAVRAVPFYDGGNVFRNPRDIFNPSNSSPTNINEQNLRALWTHTIGFGIRIKTPFGGAFAIDYGRLLNPPRFVIPQVSSSERDLPATSRSTPFPLLASFLTFKKFWGLVPARWIHPAKNQTPNRKRAHQSASLLAKAEILGFGTRPDGSTRPRTKPPNRKRAHQSASLLAKAEILGFGTRPYGSTRPRTKPPNRKRAHQSVSLLIDG